MTTIWQVTTQGSGEHRLPVTVGPSPLGTVSASEKSEERWDLSAKPAPQSFL